VSKEERLEQTMKDAWIGDAVLCLYARQAILLEESRIDSAKFVRMTSNRFLSAIGEASEVEAEIGRVYQKDGLQAAFRWIDSTLMPPFRKQETNRLKPTLQGRRREGHAGSRRDGGLA
jgi:dsRNA-specific ribonuclease